MLARLIELLAAALWNLGRIIPEKAALKLSRFAGFLTRGGRREAVLSRLNQVMGSADGAGGAKFWRDHLNHVGRNVVEPIYFFHLSDSDLLGRVDIQGEEHLRGALEGGKGAILFLNHLGNPGAIVAGLGLRGYDVTIAGNAIDINFNGRIVPLNYVEGLVQRMFARGHVRRALLGAGLPQQFSQALARNGLFAMFIDFPVVGKHNEWLPFGRSRMKVNLGPAVLALRHQVPVLNVTCIRTNGNSHLLTIHPPLTVPASGRDAAQRLLADALGDFFPVLEKHPEQWWSWDWAQIAAV